MTNCQLSEKFDFSVSIKKNIKMAFKKFLKESRKIGENFDISEEKKKTIIMAFVENMTERILEKNEREQNIRFSEDERNYFKKKILEIISK